jgi:hypothetical protein
LIQLVADEQFHRWYERFAPATDISKHRFEKISFRSILSINALFPDKKVVFFGINLVKRYLLMLLLAKSGKY